jgi:general secretion pathway protein F
MPVFEYKALDARGKTTSGIMNADSAAAARQKIREGKLFPISITEVSEGPGSKGKKRFPGFQIFNRVRASEMAMLTRQLATLVGAGFPLDSAIATLIPQSRSVTLKRQLAGIKDAIVEGSSFSGALVAFEKTFSPLFINMVKAGESSGTLAIVLERLAEITEKQQSIRNQIRAAMAYPVLMAFIGTAVLFLLLTFIVPSITAIFEDMHQTLPTPTRWLIAAGDFFRSWWWTLFVLLFLLVLGFRWFKKTHRGRYLVDRFLLRSPLIGSLTTRLSVARFSRTLASLLENGVPLLTAMDIVKGVSGNVWIQDAVTSAAVEIGKGQGLGVSLAKERIFPDLFIQMVQVGEQTAQLESMLEKTATVYEREVEASVTGLASLLEPVMILVMGVVVGFIVLSICLPIFEMNQLVR